jgi:hypothetical protein
MAKDTKILIRSTRHIFCMDLPAVLISLILWSFHSGSASANALISFDAGYGDLLQELVAWLIHFEGTSCTVFSTKNSPTDHNVKKLKMASPPTLSNGLILSLVDRICMKAYAWLSCAVAREADTTSNPHFYRTFFWSVTLVIHPHVSSTFYTHQITEKTFQDSPSLIPYILCAGFPVAFFTNNLFTSPALFPYKIDTQYPSILNCGATHT